MARPGRVPGTCSVTLAPWLFSLGLGFLFCRKPGVRPPPSWEQFLQCTCIERLLCAGPRSRTRGWGGGLPRPDPVGDDLRQTGDRHTPQPQALAAQMVATAMGEINPQGRPGRRSFTQGGQRGPCLQTGSEGGGGSHQAWGYGGLFKEAGTANAKAQSRPAPCLGSLGGKESRQAGPCGGSWSFNTAWKFLIIF